MKKTIYLLLLLGSIYAQAQTKNGKIIDSQNNNPISGVNIRNTQNNNSTTTNALGEFTIEGQGELEITADGFEKQIIYADIDFIEIKLIQVTINENPIELQAVEILGRKKNDYDSDYSFSATKTAIPNKLLPQGIGTVTKELIADRQAFQLADAVKVISGVTPSSFYNQYNIRGISQNEEGQIINGMRTRQFYFIQPLTSNIERVEVLKGPASVSFSSVDPGGSINMVTKKPLDYEKKEVSFSAGSFSTLRSTLDFTGPLNESKTLLYRVNGAYQEAKSFRDLVDNNSFLLSPSLTYKPNDKFKFPI
jgi:iron complex outermembrane recepter protein